MARKRAIIDGKSRVFDADEAMDQWRKFRSSELWTKRHMEWRPMCKELLLDEVHGWQYERGGSGAGDVLTDLSLDLAGCGPKGEWVMVEPKPIALGKSAAGRPGKRPAAGDGEKGGGKKAK